MGCLTAAKQEGLESQGHISILTELKHFLLNLCHFSNLYTSCFLKLLSGKRNDEIFFSS